MNLPNLILVSTGTFGGWTARSLLIEGTEVWRCQLNSVMDSLGAGLLHPTVFRIFKPCACPSSSAPASHRLCEGQEWAGRDQLSNRSPSAKKGWNKILPLCCLLYWSFSHHLKPRAWWANFMHPVSISPIQACKWRLATLTKGLTSMPSTISCTSMSSASKVVAYEDSESTTRSVLSNCVHGPALTLLVVESAMLANTNLRALEFVVWGFSLFANWKRHRSPQHHHIPSQTIHIGIVGWTEAADPEAPTGPSVRVGLACGDQLSMIAESWYPVSQSSNLSIYRSPRPSQTALM